MRILQNVVVTKCGMSFHAFVNRLAPSHVSKILSARRKRQRLFLVVEMFEGENG